MEKRVYKEENAVRLSDNHVELLVQEKRILPGKFLRSGLKLKWFGPVLSLFALLANLS